MYSWTARKKPKMTAKEIWHCFAKMHLGLVLLHVAAAWEQQLMFAVAVGSVASLADLAALASANAAATFVIAMTKCLDPSNSVVDAGA